MGNIKTKYLENMLFNVYRITKMYPQGASEAFKR